jgi:hypothetical protein
MAFTRFHDDPCRIMKHLQESTDQGVYTLNVPGNGLNVPFLNDPHIRLQKWGANRHSNFVKIESDLFGMQNKLGAKNPKTDIDTYPVHYSLDATEITSQPRTVAPAWEVRSAPQPRWETPHVDLQAHALIPFPHNTGTRQLARDLF